MVYACCDLEIIRKKVCLVKVYGYFFLLCFERETIFMNSCLLTWRTKLSLNGVNSTKMNLL